MSAVRRKLGLLAGSLIILGLFGWAMWYAFSTPTGVIAGPPPTLGLPTACTLADEALVGKLVPDAEPSHRDLDRNSSACTLSGRDRVLRIEITRYVPYGGSSGTELARDTVARHRAERALFNRSWLPKPQELTGLGDEAVVFLGPYGDTTSASLVVRRDALVILVRYDVPPAPPASRTGDTTRYTTVAAGARSVVEDLLARL